MSILRNRKLPIILASLVGTIYIVEYFFTISWLEMALKDIKNWGIVIGGFAGGLGAIGITINQARKMRKPGPLYPRLLNAWTILMLYGFLILGLIPPIVKSTLFRYWYEATVIPIGATLYASLGFYVTSAAYRAFRARNFETMVFLTTGLIIVLYNTPLIVYYWPGVDTIGRWILEVPNLGAQRGLLMGAGVGAIILLLRTLIGRETGWLGGGTE